MAPVDVASRIAAFATSPETRGPDAERRLEDLVGELRASPLDGAQVASLALALAKSGQVIDWSDDPRLAGKVSVDLPSTGGSSNKTPIIAPLIALAAARDRIYIPKFSSRGRFAGTIDILESVGYDPNISINRYREIVGEIGISNVVQGNEFAPADGELMSLRRRTNAMDVPELVVSSILAKKLASGCRHIVVDMKTGADSKFGDLNGILVGARLFTEAASALIEQGRLDGLWVCCTNGSRPQGRTFGRLAALWESTLVLSGAEPGFLLELSIALAARMLVLTGVDTDLDKAAARCRAAVGPRAIAATGSWLRVHGARTDFLEDCDLLLEDVGELPFESEAGGVLLAIDIRAVEHIVSHLTASRGGRNAAGLILNVDPSGGRSLAEPLLGRVLGPANAEWSSEDRNAAASTIVAYRGDAPVYEQPQIIYERAVLREREVEQHCWSRVSRAAAAMIHRAGTAEVLLVFNRKWNCWNLPAGHFEPGRDRDLADTIGREISEELGPEIGMPAPVPGADFTYISRGYHRDIWKSGSAGIWTYYEFDLFALQFADARWLEQLVERNPGMLCWATLSELKSGRLANGASVAPFPVVFLALDGAFSEP